MSESHAEVIHAVLAELWSLVRLLRKLGGLVEHPGTQEALKRVRMDLSGHCAALSALVRELGSRPIDSPSETARQIESTQQERDLWSLLDKGLEGICSRLHSVSFLLTSPHHRQHVGAIESSLHENRRWLGQIRPRE